VSAGEDARPHRLSSAICQFIKHVQHAFWHDTISSVFAHTFRYNVTDMPNLSLTRRPPTLTRDVRHEKLDSSTRKRSRIKLRMPHITIIALYTVQLSLVSTRTRISSGGVGSDTGCPPGLVTNCRLKMVTDPYTVDPYTAGPSRSSAD